ncbi:MAG: GlsB/YeaQ/YmgE family stress response membrane protein [Actinomycetota bacterium]
MNIIAVIVLGLVVGALARLVMPGRQPIGFLWTMVIGVLGALIGNAIGEKISPDGTMHWILAVVVAVVLLLIYGSVTGRRTTS